MSAPHVERPAAARGVLAPLIRQVNRQIVARTRLEIVAVACECEDRSCEAALEVPLVLFRVVDARPTYFVVASGHEQPFAERIVRRDGGYVVVSRDG
jgi:hypothetical protein